jgi:transposase-like protein
MYLMTSTRSGISAKQLERELGVTYKTAWRVFHLIRNELMQQDDELVLDGEVEADEMYVGGRPHQSEQNKWGPPNSKERRQGAMAWHMQRRTGVFGMVERKGKVSAFVIPQQPGKVIMGHISSKIAPTAQLYTDESKLYARVTTNTGIAHATINHSAKVYVSGNVHTQTIESFWSQVKRGIVGVHGAVSPKHLQGYLNEYVWRFNHRNDGRIMFFTLAQRAAMA